MLIPYTDVAALNAYTIYRQVHPDQQSLAVQDAVFKRSCRQPHFAPHEEKTESFPAPESHKSYDKMWLIFLQYISAREQGAEEETVFAMSAHKE